MPHPETSQNISQQQEKMVIKLTLDNESNVVVPPITAEQKANNRSVASLGQQSTERTSNTSSDDEEKKQTEKHLPTFTNEVIVIRPEYFYENTDCQKDNKFMKNSNLQRDSTNE